MHICMHVAHPSTVWFSECVQNITLKGNKHCSKHTLIHFPDVKKKMAK